MHDHTQGRSNAVLPRGSPHLCTMSGGNEEERQEDLPLVPGPVGEGKEPAVKCHHQDHRGGAKQPTAWTANSVLSSPVPQKKAVNAIKGRVLTPAKQTPKVGKGIPVLAKRRVLAPVKVVGKGSPVVKKVDEGSPVLAKKKQSVGGAAVVRFEGTCPLCGKKFMDAVLLETHASECDGGGDPEQVKCFVFPSKIHLRCRSYRPSSPCQQF